MKLSDHQAHLLLLSLRDSCVVESGQVFSLSRDRRNDLFAEIINQQDTAIKDLDGSKDNQ